MLWFPRFHFGHVSEFIPGPHGCQDIHVRLATFFLRQVVCKPGLEMFLEHLVIMEVRDMKSLRQMHQRLPMI